MLLLDGILGGCGSLVELLSCLSSGQISGALGCYSQSFVADLLMRLRLPLATDLGRFLRPAFVHIGLPRGGLHNEFATCLSSIVVRFGSLQRRCTERRASLALIGALLTIDSSESYAELAARIYVLRLSLVLHLARRSGLLIQRLVVSAEASRAIRSPALDQIRQEHLVEVGCRRRLRRRHVVMMLAAGCSLRALRRCRLVKVELIVVVGQGGVHAIAH